MTIKLRAYQQEALDAVRTALEGGMHAPAVVLPTGAGKTVVFATMAAEYGGRTLVLAHRDELVRQAVAKTRAVAPHLGVGTVKAATDEHDATDVVVASVQTLAATSGPARLARIASHGLDRIIVDECHHATAPSYLRLFDALPAVPRIGVTATMMRGDGASLGTVWDQVVYERDITYMIRHGYLVDVSGRRVIVDDLDLSGVARRGGDYADGSLGEAVVDSHAADAIVAAIAEFAPSDPGVVFAPTVDAARHIASVMAASGLKVGVVWGDQGIDERRATLAAFDAGDLDWLCNCAVLTEGWDSPRAAVAVIARPTTSQGLYVQMVGRVLRPLPGKRAALVLDIVGSAAGLSLCALSDLAGLPESQRQNRDGATLLDLIDEHEATEAADSARPARPITLVTEEVELFRGSTSAWVRTYGGTWVLCSDTQFVAVMGPQSGPWSVAWGNIDGPGGGYVARDVEDIGYAMAHAEGWAGEFIPALYADRARPWRAKRPTDKQLAFARRLGLRVEPEHRAGDVAELITRAKLSRRIDPVVAETRGAGVA